MRLFSIFRNNLTLRSVSFRHAIRLGTVAALSFVLGEFLHVRRSYWVVVTVLVVLKPNFGGTIERVIQRIGGTIMGGLIALLVALWIREREGLFVCVALLAFVSFSVRQFGYGIFTLALTPLFLVLLDLANPGDWTVNLIRIQDTLIGGLLAFGGSLLFPIWERELLPMQLSRTISTLREYFDRVMMLYLGQAAAPREVSRARSTASLEVANAAAASQRLLSEPVRMRDEMEPTLTVANYARRLMLTLTALDEHIREYPGRGQPAGLKPFVEEMSRQLGNLAESLKGPFSLERSKDLDWRLGDLRDRVESLSVTRLGELAENQKREDTATVAAIREESVLFAQLQRLMAHVAVLCDAVGRLNPKKSRESRSDAVIAG
jgi:uncharacterized membrane protein YccC